MHPRSTDPCFFELRCHLEQDVIPPWLGDDLHSDGQLADVSDRCDERRKPNQRKRRRASAERGVDTLLMLIESHQLVGAIWRQTGRRGRDDQVNVSHCREEVVTHSGADVLGSSVVMAWNEGPGKKSVPSQCSDPLGSVAEQVDVGGSTLHRCDQLRSAAPSFGERHDDLLAGLHVKGNAFDGGGDLWLDPIVREPANRRCGEMDVLCRRAQQWVDRSGSRVEMADCGRQRSGSVESRRQRNDRV